MTDEADPTAAPTRTDLVWQALADELVPVKSLVRIDTATARVLTSVTVVGTLLGGLGLVGVGDEGTDNLARGLAIGVVGVSALAVVLALAGQILTIRRGLNTNNLVAVRAWYVGQFRRRAYPARAATVLLVVAVLLASGTAIAELLDPARLRPSFAVSQTFPPATTDAASIVVEVTFRGLGPDDTAVLTVEAGEAGGGGRTIAHAVFAPGADGVATRTLTATPAATDVHVEVVATTPGQRCQAWLDADPGRPPTAICDQG